MPFYREKILMCKLEEELFIAEVIFKDDFHDFKLIVKANLELEIKECEIFMDRKPYEICSQIIDTCKKVNGIKVEKGYTKKIKELTGGRNGCVHLVDMLTEAGRALIQEKIGYIYDTQGKEAFREFLKESCIAY